LRGALAEFQAQLERVFHWAPVAFGLGAPRRHRAVSGRPRRRRWRWDRRREGRLEDRPLAGEPL